MKRHLAAALLALALGVVGPGRTQAQILGGPRPIQITTTAPVVGSTSLVPAGYASPVPAGGIVYHSGYAGAVDMSYSAGTISAPVVLPAGTPFPYSTASATRMQPARWYVSYGGDDPYPFYGTPYGHAYDRYTWGALSGESSLNRYFYPPVR